jgi:hypothetical protein
MRQLIERTAGNPFFLEESVCTSVSTRVLVGEPGAYRLATVLPIIQVPATVLAARMAFKLTSVNFNDGGYLGNDHIRSTAYALTVWVATSRRNSPGMKRQRGRRVLR